LVHFRLMVMHISRAWIRTFEFKTCIFSTRPNL